MPNIFVKDGLRSSVESLTGGKITVLYDTNGVPSYMYILNRFEVEDKNFNKIPILDYYADEIHPLGIINFQIDNRIKSDGIRPIEEGDYVHYVPPEPSVGATNTLYSVMPTPNRYQVDSVTDDYVYLIDLAIQGIDEGTFTSYPNQEYLIKSTNYCGSGYHPAFKYKASDGTFDYHDEIFIGQFISASEGNSYFSMPGFNPTSGISYLDSAAAASNKGVGWHMMTNWEWSAMVFDGLASGHNPGGNTWYGRYDPNFAGDNISPNYNYQSGVRVDGLVPGTESGDGTTYTGSGPLSWTHNGEVTGIADAIGNKEEWINGFAVNNGQLFIPRYNKTSTISAAAGTDIISSAAYNKGGAYTPQLDVSSNLYTINGSKRCEWTDMPTTAAYDDDSNVPQSDKYLLQQALIDPSWCRDLNGHSYGHTSVYRGSIRPTRGGYWKIPRNETGFFNLRLVRTDASIGSLTGFRLAYTPSIS